jgi:hypothetical protein
VIGTIPITDSIDLDGTDPITDDIGFYEVGGSASITLTNGIAIAAIENPPYQQAGCEAMLASQPVAPILAQQDAYICVQTNESKYVLVKLVQVSDKSVEIQYIRW